jgi:hypothetical protein
MHNVFHISQLEQWRSRNPEDLTEVVEELPDLEQEDAEWELEELRDHSSFQNSKSPSHATYFVPFISGRKI